MYYIFRGLCRMPLFWSVRESLRSGPACALPTPYIHPCTVTFSPPIFCLPAFLSVSRFSPCRCRLPDCPTQYRSCSPRFPFPLLFVLFCGMCPPRGMLVLSFCCDGSCPDRALAMPTGSSACAGGTRMVWAGRGYGTPSSAWSRRER